MRNARQGVGSQTEPQPCSRGRGQARHDLSDRIPEEESDCRASRSETRGDGLLCKSIARYARTAKQGHVQPSLPKMGIALGN